MYVSALHTGVSVMILLHTGGIEQLSNFTTYITGEQSVTLSCSRSQEPDSQDLEPGNPEWYIYTKESAIKKVTLHARYSHLDHSLTGDATSEVFSITLSSFGSSIDEYFVICALLQSDHDIHHIEYPMQPYIISVQPLPTDEGCATTTDADNKATTETIDANNTTTSTATDNKAATETINIGITTTDHRHYH